MSITYFIFSRIKEINSNKGFFSFNLFLSILLISISLISLIVTDSITNGYRNSLYDKVRSFGSDFRIVNSNSNFITKSDYLELSGSLYSLYHKNLHPYFETIGIINIRKKIGNKFINQRESVILYGIDREVLNSTLSIDEFLLSDTYNFENKDIIIGSELANILNIAIDDSLALLVKNDIGNIIFDYFRIENIYDTDTKYDAFIAFIPFEAAQNLLTKDSILHYATGLLFDNIGSDVQEYLNDYINLRNNFHLLNHSQDELIILTWEDLNLGLVKFLSIFDIPIKLLASMLLLLSTFSLYSTLKIFIFERREEFFLLHVLGLGKEKIRNIIIFLGSYISIVSSLIAIILSYILLVAQNKYHLFQFPSKMVFQLQYVNAELNFMLFIKYVSLVFLLSIFISYYLFRKFSYK